MSKNKNDQIKSL